MRHHLLKTLFIIGLMIMSFRSIAQERVIVDERQELSAIVWRLAGCEEYNTRINPSYLENIETYFGGYKGHPVMDFIREMRTKKDSISVVAYNSVPMSAAVLQIRNNRVKINPDVNLIEYIAGNDSRWTEQNLRKYVKLLDDFYRKSEFRQFFDSHADLYASYIAEMTAVFQDNVKAEWFRQFYGMELPGFNVIVSPANGINNYALNEDILNAAGYDGIGALMGVSYNPEKGKINRNTYVPILLHEISHYFTNQIFFPDYTEQLTAAGAKIFEHLSEPLTAAGYGAAYIVCPEFLNELCAMMYTKEVLGSTLANEVRACYRKGFIWADECIRYMENFTANREQYSRFSDFIPQLVGFMESIADNIKPMKDAFYTAPYIVYSYPCAGSTVSPDISEIVFRLSQPMETGITAFDAHESAELFIDDSWYETHDDEPEYWKDEYTYVIRVWKKLEQGKKYGIVIPATLCNRNGINMTDDYVYEFNIK